MRFSCSRTSVAVSCASSSRAVNVSTLSCSVAQSSNTQPLLPQASTHGSEQRIRIDGFSEDAEILLLDEIARIAGHHDDGNPACVSVRRELLLDEHAVETGQPQIQDDEIGRLFFDETKRVEAVADVIDVEPRQDERRAIEVPQLGIILDDEDSWTLRQAAIFPTLEIIVTINKGRASASTGLTTTLQSSEQSPLPRCDHSQGSRGFP